jgi:hypothetical protein
MASLYDTLRTPLMTPTRANQEMLTGMFSLYVLPLAYYFLLEGLPVRVLVPADGCRKKARRLSLLPVANLPAAASGPIASGGSWYWREERQPVSPVCKIQVFQCEKLAMQSAETNQSYELASKVNILCT